MNLVARALIEPSLNLEGQYGRGGILLSVNGGENEGAHLDPAPDGGEEGRRIDDSNCVERLGVVRSGEFGGLLEVPAE